MTERPYQDHFAGVDTGTATPSPNQRMKVRRVLEYEGEADWVRMTLAKGIHGRYGCGRGTVTEVSCEEVPTE